MTFRYWLLFAFFLPLWALRLFRITVGVKFHLALPMLILILLGISFLPFFFLRGHSHIKKIPKFWLIYTFFTVQIFSLLCSSLFYGEIANAFKLIITLAFGISLYILMTLTIKDFRQLERMFQLTFIFGTILLIVLIYRYLFVFHSQFLGNNIFVQTGGGRNQLGFFLSLFTPLMLSYTVFHKSWKSFIGSFVFLGASIYTLSRATWVSVIVAIAFLLITSKHRKKYIRFLVLFTVIISIFLSFYPQLISSLKNRLTESMTLTERSIARRIDLASVSLRSFLSHPVFGVGLGNFDKVAVPHGLNPASHNDYLQILVEQGIIGLLVFLFLLGSIFIKAVRTLKRNTGEIRWLQEGIAASLVSMIVGFLFINAYETLPVWYIFGAGAVLQKGLGETESCYEKNAGNLE